MDLGLTETQSHLGQSVQSFLTRLTYAPMEPKAPRQPSMVWRELATDLGLLSLFLPEDKRGFGGAGGELLVVSEAIGKHLFEEPFIDVAVTTLSLLQCCESVDELVEKVSLGEIIIASALFEPDKGWNWRNIETRAVFDGVGSYLITGNRGPIVAGTQASSFLVTAWMDDDSSPSLFLVDASNCIVQPVAMMDERWAAFLSMHEAPAKLLLRGEPAVKAIELAIDKTIAALCAEGAGIVSRMLDETVEFTKQRRQFGQPISRFQVLQHRMADMLIQVEMARSAALLACLSLDKTPSERAAVTSAAKSTVCKALKFVGQSTIQMHGGLGMSAETTITRWFKRATVLEHYYGTSAFHIDRFLNAD